MLFKLKRLVKRVMATLLVTITFMSVVPIGVFAPFVSYAAEPDEDGRNANDGWHLYKRAVVKLRIDKEDGIKNDGELSYFKDGSEYLHKLVRPLTLCGYLQKSDGTLNSGTFYINIYFPYSNGSTVEIGSGDVIIIPSGPTGTVAEIHKISWEKFREWVTKASKSNDGKLILKVPGASGYYIGQNPENYYYYLNPVGDYDGTKGSGTVEEKNQGSGTIYGPGIRNLYNSLSENYTINSNNYSLYPVVSGNYVDDNSGSNIALLDLFEPILTISKPYGLLDIKTTSQGSDNCTTLENLNNTLNKYEYKDKDGNTVNASVSISETGQLYFKSDTVGYVQKNSALERYMKVVFNTKWSLSNKNKYPECYELYNNCVGSILEAVKQEKQEMEKEAAGSATTDDADKAIKSLTSGESALEAWMLLINNFFNTGNSKILSSDYKSLGLDEDMYDKIKMLDLKDYGWKFLKDEFTDNGTVVGSDNSISGDLKTIDKFFEKETNKDTIITRYKLDPYEDLKLRIYYSIQCQYRYPEGNLKDTIKRKRDNLKLDSKFAVNNSFSTEELGDGIGTPNYYFKGMKNNADNPPDIFKDKGEIETDAAKAAQSEFAKVEGDISPNVRVLAENFNAVMKYMTYGIITNDANGRYADSMSSTANIPYSEAIPKIIPSLNLDGEDGLINSNDDTTTISSESIDFGKFGLPDMSNINKIANSKFSKGKISQLYLSLMYIKKYASIPKEYDNANGWWNVKNTTSIGGLKYREDSVFEDYSNLDYKDVINPKIEDFLKDKESLSVDEKKKLPPDKEVGMFIKSYISIHEGIDYIGLDIQDDWVSVELRAIYEYYNRIKDWKDVVAEKSYNLDALPPTQPFGEFFNLATDNSGGQRGFSDYIRMGIGASATYLPLVTNTFDYDAISVVDDADFVSEFHYKYGFHRKALFIDSNSNAALQSYVTGQKDSLKVATLEDMMQPDKDIVLYIDPSFYNIRQLAEKQNLSYNKLQNTEESGSQETGFIQGVADMWSEWRNLDAASICKTAGANLYSDALGNSAVQAYGTDKNENNFWKIGSKNHYVLSSDAIDEYYKSDEYSDVQSFAFVSGIYRCAALLNICQAQSANPKPVFVSSPTLPFVEGVSKKEFNSIYNYLMVKNLKANLGLDYKTELDLDSPLFIDVYGNITTQSGLVVIPAASNATLYEPNEYSIVTAGLASLAANVDSWQIPVDSANVEKFLDSGFVKDPNTDTYKLQNKATQTVELNFTNLPLQSDGVKRALYNDAYINSGTGAISGNNTFEPRVNMIMEVMRGAPVENIDFEEEGLAGYRNLDKTGIYIAYRIEQLGDMLLSSSEGNSLLKMPNLAFMEGVEYIVVIVFKILLAAGIFLLWFKLYADGATNSIGIRTGIDFMLSISSVIIGIILIPTLINFSYYQTNKQLLQNEAAYLLILNTEKNAEGKEVGVKEVKAPSSTTKFYIKLNEIKVPWWTVIQDVYSSEMFARMEDVYEDAYESSIYSTFPGAMKRGNGIYVNTDDLFKSSEIRFVPDTDENTGNDDNQMGHLVQAVLPNNKMSYVLPYYAIIDKLLYDAELYNKSYSASAYRTKILQNGNVRTIGLLEAYFKSNQFLQSDEMNLFGFYDMYNIPYSTDFRQQYFNENEIDTMSKSLWYNKDAFSDEEVRLKLEKLDELGKQFIVDNRTLLNKVTDETFIKVFALYMSIQHNNLFKVPAARGIELMEIDTKDIIRLSLAPKADVMHSISMSFGRFTFTQAGTFGTILMAFLLLIYYFTSLIKPIVMIILVGGLIFSYVWKKLMRYEQNHSLEGYIVSCALICLVNLIYALVIKISVMLPDFGVDPIFSILMQIVLQAAYVGVLYLIGYVVLKNSRDLGFFTYKTFYDAHMANKVQAMTMSANKLMANSIFAPFSQTANSMRNDYLSNRRTAGLTGDDIYTRMQQNDELRRNDVNNNYNRRY